MDSTHSLQAWIGNIVSVGAIITSALGFVPAVAALVAFIWYLIQIYESVTVQRWLANRRLRKIAKLKARVVVLEALNRLPTLEMKIDADDV